MSRRLLSVPKVLFGFHLASGLALIVALVSSSPLAIGRGGFDAFVRALEEIDFRWWLLAVVVSAWLVPIALVLVWWKARGALLEAEGVRRSLERMLAGRSLPIKVDIDTRLPVRFDAPLEIPVEVDTHIDLDQEIEVEAEVPIQAELPIDTEIETSVLRFGSIKVPISARIPVDVVLPLRTRIRVRAQGVPVKLREIARVELPTIDVPISSRVEARLDLLTNLRSAEELLRKAPDAGKGPSRAG